MNKNIASIRENAIKAIAILYLSNNMLLFDRSQQTKV